MSRTEASVRVKWSSRLRATSFQIMATLVTMNLCPLAGTRVEASQGEPITGHAATELDAFATSTIADETEVIEATAAANTDVQKPVLLAVLFRNASTCIVGDPCTGTCTEITRPDDTVVARFEANDHYRSLRPSDPTVLDYPNRVCLQLALSPAEQREAKASLIGYRDAVFRASGGRMELQIVIKRIGRTELALGRFFNGFWIDPGAASDSVSGFVDASTDGILVTGGTLDREQNVRLPIAACGLSFGADFGLGGAGYSWIPYSNGYFFQCDQPATNYHEWLHEVDFALEKVMDVPDIYASGYPACGLADPDPHKWFPNADTCTSDPDWQDCGAPTCVHIDIWNDHILSTHYDFTRQYIGNHCRDGRQDFGESGVDVGGACATGIHGLPSAGPDALRD